MTPKQTSDTRTIKYNLNFDDNTNQEFMVTMDANTLDIIQEPKEEYPQWTKLSCQKCSNCPLDENEHEYCPIAQKMADPVEFLCKPAPSKDVFVRIETPERVYSKNVDLKTAAFSLLGIYMSTGGCPVMDKLRPMSRFHLPFATTLETTYRSIANYLIAQYLLSHEGKETDFGLEHLPEIYEGIETVNGHFRERLQEVSSQNYALTGLLQLDSFASYINMSLNSEQFFLVESLFNKEFQQDETEIAEGSGEKLTFQYQFKVDDQTKEFNVDLDKETLNPLAKKKDKLPAWTELSCNKCPNCPLDEKKNKHCPAATGVSEAIEFFKDMVSTKEAEITVKTEERIYSADLPATAGISAMMGLIMASSGCPILGKLKPLVRNHLPFASNKETVYRSLGMYLLGQFFLSKAGKTPDWKLENLTKLYEDINVVNKAFCNRLREPTVEDANLNALIKLDCFAQQIGLTVADGNIEELLTLFRAYLN